MNKQVLAFLQSEEGLTTVEYAIAGGLIAAGVIGAFTSLGQQITAVISAIAEALTGVAASF